MKKRLKDNKTFEVIFIAGILLLVSIWIGCICVEGTNSRQFETFFLSTGDFLADATNVTGYSSQRDVYHNTMYTGLGEKAYPPLSYLISYLFSRTVDMTPYWQNSYFVNMYQNTHFMIIYMIFLIATMVILYQTLCRCKEGPEVIRSLAAFAVILSAPLMYSVERGNFIIHTLICTLVYLRYYDDKTVWKRELALMCLAIATSFKMTPAVLGIFLIYDKKWKEIAHVIVYGIIFGLLPFLFFKGGFANIATMFQNMKLNLDAYNSSEGCTLYASFLNMGLSGSEALQTAFKYITYVICLFFVVTAPMLKGKWQRWLSILLVLLIAPSHSGQYCILYLIPAMISFLNEKEHAYAEYIILIAFLLIMNPLQGGAWTKLDYHFSIIVLVIYMLVLSAVTVFRVIQAKTAGNIRTAE